MANWECKKCGVKKDSRCKPGACVCGAPREKWEGEKKTASKKKK